MADTPLSGKRVAIFVDDGASLRELTDARALLAAAGATVVLVAASTKVPYRDKAGTTDIAADAGSPALRATDFDGLVIPGGHAPDRIRMRHAMVEFVVALVAAGKPVAAICHGPQVLITANVLKGRTLTCWPSIAVDVKNAGGRYVDRPAVRDGVIITGRKGDDVPAVMAVFIEALAEPSAATS